MKICIIGKYPPIQGGVSASTYWLAYGLAERGHQVYVITNATEVEQAYRMYMNKNDAGWYEPTFSSGGFVHVSTPESFGVARMSYIPLANPFVSKLAGLATQIIMQHDCELIFSYYFEPYAMAGYLASVWTGLPLIVKHAGSDLDRLMTVPDLAVAYKEMLRAADGIMTSGGLVKRFTGMGIKKEQIIPAIHFTVPTRVFTPDAPPLSVHDLVSEITDGEPQESTSKFDPTRPTIGIYGKIGTSKGSYDLVHALALLKAEGLQFNFLAMTQGSQLEQFRRAIDDYGLEDRTQLLPFLPHWRVPSFIRVCTAVCFLERDFPILIHGPIVPREVLACGTCLVLSGEIADKQRYDDEFVDGENVLIVSDPKDHDKLAAQLRLVVTRPEQAVEIGARGYQLSRIIEGDSAFIDDYISVFSRYGRNAEDGPVGIQEGYEDSSLAARIERIAPVSRLLLDTRFEDVVVRFAQQRETAQATDEELALAFCDFAGASLHEVLPEAEAAPIREMLTYQKMQSMSSFGLQEQYSPAFAATNALGNKRVNWRSVAHLKPLRGNQVLVVEFEYDITPIFTDPQLDIEEIPLWKIVSHAIKRRTLVCFSLSPNLAHHELKISPVIRDLLDLCDGEHTTAAIIRRIAGAYGLKTEDEMEALQRNILSTLEQLYSKQIIIFAR